MAQDATPPGEQPVAPYTQSNANAGATPLTDTRTFEAFHGVEGIRRIVNDTIDRSAADPRIAEIFISHDLLRIKRTLSEQICYVLGGPCTYTGRDMATAHRDLGVQTRDFNILVEHLREAMSRERVPFPAQNRLLAILAPMHRDVVAR